MAFRSVGKAVNGGAGASVTLPMPAGVALGDQCLAFLSVDASGNNSTSAGWTQIGSAIMAGPDAQAFTLLTRVATGSEPGSYVFANSGATNLGGFIGAWSGRDGTALTSSNVVATTPVTSGQATPVAASITGLTAVGGDDLVVLVGLDYTTGGGDVWTSAAPSSYTKQAEVNASDSPATQFMHAAMHTLDNASAGATGTLTSTCTRTSGSGTAGYAAFIVRIPSSGAPPFTPRLGLMGVG